MPSDLISVLLASGQGKSDYRFFFDSVQFINRHTFRTDDLHYYLYRFLRDGNRENFLAGLIKSGSPMNGSVLNELPNKRLKSDHQFLQTPGILEQYQDIWLKGSMLLPGIRECSDRFDLIAKYLRRIKKPFTVLDIGANLGYFSLRIAENFDAVCVCVEHIYSEWLCRILEANNNERIYAINSHMTLEDLHEIGKCEQFDVVLGLSVLHHFESPAADVLDALKCIGRHVIIELPTEKTACGGEWLEGAINLNTDNFEILGYGKSHLDGNPRPIVACTGNIASIKQPYILSSRQSEGLCLNINDNQNNMIKNGIESDFVPGFNAHTFLYFGGFYPDPAKLIDQVNFYAMKKPHYDLTCWNIVLHASGALIIDEDNDPFLYGFFDNLQIAMVSSIFALCGYEQLQDLENLYQFYVGRPEVKLLGLGWASPEDWAVWSVDSESELIVHGHIILSDIRIEIDVKTAPLPKGHHSRITLFVINNTPLVSFKTPGSSEERIVFHVNRSIWNSHNPAKIKILNSVLFNPKQEGMNEDNRNIGLALKSLSITYLR